MLFSCSALIALTRSELQIDRILSHIEPIRGKDPLTVLRNTPGGIELQGEYWAAIVAGESDEAVRIRDLAVTAYRKAVEDRPYYHIITREFVVLFTLVWGSM